MPNSDAVLDFQIPPQPHLCRAVRNGVAEFARSHGVGESDLSALLTALGEALVNAIEHAQGSDAIEIECRIGAGRIVATVQDSGAGCASDDFAHASFPEGMEERGRGVPIMRHCTDIFSVRSFPGKGTAVVLGRFLRKAGSCAIGF